VIRKKRAPTLDWLGISRCPLHPAGDGSLGYIKAQQEQLAVNARRTPGEFSATIRKISSRTSVDSFFLPTSFLACEIKLQYSRNPARCQRTTVSAVTTRRDLFQLVQNRHASTQKSLSTGLSFGLARLRFNTASCWRSARFSRSSLRRERKQRATSPKLSRAKLHMYHSHSKS
jgi:hypothetical protein